MGTLPEDTSRGVEAVKVPETRNAVRGTWGALGATRKIKFYLGNSLSWQLQAPLFLAARMRIILGNSIFFGSKKVMIFVQKTEIRNNFLRVLVAQNSCKIAPNHLGGDQKNQVLISGIRSFGRFQGSDYL